MQRKKWVRRRMAEMGVTAEMLARRCQCTVTLIEYAQRGLPVHPVFAQRIADALMTKPALERWRDGVRIGGEPKPWESGDMTFGRGI